MRKTAVPATSLRLAMGGLLLVLICACSGRSSSVASTVTGDRCGLAVQSSAPAFEATPFLKPEFRWSIYVRFDSVAHQLAFTTRMASIMTSDPTLRQESVRSMTQIAGEPEGPAMVIDLRDTATLAQACDLWTAVLPHLQGVKEVSLIDTRG